MSVIAAGSWLVWAFLLAIFAAMTAICAKVGVEGIDSDLTTFFRTVVIIVVLGVLLAITGKFALVGEISRRSWAFLTLSGLATSASWLCYLRALKVGEAACVAPIDKLSVGVRAVIGVALLGEHLSVRGWLEIELIGAGAVLVALP